MGLFKKRKTLRRCRTLRSYVGGIDEGMVDDMARFLLEDKRNTVQATREYLMFVSAAGVIVSAVPVTPLRDDFEAIAISSSWARIASPAGRQRDDGFVGTTSDAGSASSFDRDDRSEEDLANGVETFDSSSWTSFSDSDGSSFTNNNNNNNNNNG